MKKRSNISKICQYLLAIIIFLSNFLFALPNPSENINSIVESEEFKNYWYQGKAELSKFELEQARYGEIHKGHAVLIFVTEPLLTDKQVKFEHGDISSAITILKLNASKYFYTGIYPYSILTSVFTPVDLYHWPKTLKVSNSNQEWCGQTYTQFNLRDKHYNVIQHSYFQKEADQEYKLPEAILEDEIWTRIRLAPHSLPTGDIKIIPPTHFSRLKHIDLKIYDAVAKISSTEDHSLSDKHLQVYELDYKNLDRKLKIFFEKTFPFTIVGWEEIYQSGWEDNAKILTTKARREHSVSTDYWSKNSVADSTFRKMLGL
jgi:hypothetical protein